MNKINYLFMVVRCYFSNYFNVLIVIVISLYHGLRLVVDDIVVIVGYGFAYVYILCYYYMYIRYYFIYTFKFNKLIQI